MTEQASRSTDSDPGFSPPVRVGETVAGKYVIGRRIGIGGMGAVFEAQDTRLDRRVAIKFLLPHLAASPIAAGRFKREAKSATRITSEHVVKVLEIDDLPDGTPMLVMEYLEGQDLRQLLQESGPLPAELAVDYVMQALQAIAEGHNTSIIHRDLKPSNLFRTARADGSHVIKVLDFGIAKTLDGEGPSDHALTSTDDSRLGSPAYMPPEQFDDPRNVDARSDFWALGVTLYELISGRMPFHGFNIPELRAQVFNHTPDSLQAFAPSSAVPPGLEPVIAKCLAKARSDRYLTASELAIALAPFGSDDALVSRNRISNLGRPRTPNPVSPPRGSLTPYQATLPVGGNERPHTDTSSGARPVARVAGRRAGLVLAAALGLGVTALGGAMRVWHSGAEETPRTVSNLSPAKPASSHELPTPINDGTPGTDTKVPSPGPQDQPGDTKAPPASSSKRGGQKAQQPTSPVPTVASAPPGGSAVPPKTDLAPDPTAEAANLPISPRQSGDPDWARRLEEDLDAGRK